MSPSAQLNLEGIHHLTAITANARGNKTFYTEVLGMRLVKRTVNQDDVSAYHLFYADQVATPGTDITFFDWDVPREQRGTRSIVQTGFRVSGEASLHYWEACFQEKNVPSLPIAERDGRLCLDFEDPEGQRLALVEDRESNRPGVPWSSSPVPAEHQMLGLGPITISVPELEGTGRMLTDLMNFRRVREYARESGSADSVHVFETGDGGPHAELHVAVEPRLPRARPGAGGVHHVAFRTPDETQYHQWHARLTEAGIANSGEIDRFYFRSLYFREPGGILFEIATDGPGFGVDEDMSKLGEAVSLPPFLEPRRDQILSGLKPID